MDTSELTRTEKIPHLSIRETESLRHFWNCKQEV
ncbi:MAG: hypothetical protein JWN46_1992 [Acidimicrobiales bacterium]|nr:hypothetical protein [Acidimicrobiales bacterium]